MDVPESETALAVSNQKPSAASGKGLDEPKDKSVVADEAHGSLAGKLHDTVDISDAIALLAHLFGVDPALPDPFPGCGPDPTAGEMTCDAYEPCGP